MFADNFKRICNERGTTPTALVTSLGLSSAKVTIWNNGSLPKQEVLVLLAKTLRCSVMDFFADTDHLTPTESQLDDDELDIIRVYRLLDRRAKHEFMARVYDYEAQYRAD